jgi:hypothetical protein
MRGDIVWQMFGKAYGLKMNRSRATGVLPPSIRQTLKPVKEGFWYRFFERLDFALHRLAVSLSGIDLENAAKKSLFLLFAKSCLFV